MPDRSASNLRLLAPVAVAVFAVLLLIVLLTSGAISGGDSSQSAGSASGERQSERSERRRARRERERASYTIQTGDTLGSIASENDVSVERLQELNPQLDPQALTAGQRIRLRE